MAGDRACGILVSRYPSVTHTFVRNEVAALRALGWRIETASVRRTGSADAPSPADRAEQAATYALLPASPAALIAAHLRALVRAPGAYVRTLTHALRLAPAPGRKRLWQLFYFGESMLAERWMRRRGLAHLHVHHANVSADVALLACHYARLTGRAWTWSLTLHGPTEFADVAAHNLPAKIAAADAVVCICDYVHAQVLALADDQAAARTTVVRVGIDVGAFSVAARSTGSRPVILCVGALSRRKGHAVLLDAFAAVRARGVDAALVLVGDGAERGRLEAQAARLGIAADVTFAGAVGHDRIVGEHYARADVFCLASFMEGLPTVLMEAMAAGVPVVATNAMGTAELVRDDSTGLLVAPARADELAAALERLLGDAELRARLAEAGRAVVEAEHDVHVSAQRLSGVLARCEGTTASRTVAA